MLPQPLPWDPMPKIPVSWGEIFDKETILRIKAKRLSSAEKRANVAREISELALVIGDTRRFPNALASLVQNLLSINEKLWDIEEGKRQAEKIKRFDESFIALARAVYIENDRRAAVKRQINVLLGSYIVEEKSYE